MIYVRNGRIVYQPHSFSDGYTWEPLTPRELARARAEAAARWTVIVDLMLAGQRLTSGGRVIPALAWQRKD